MAGLLEGKIAKAIYKGFKGKLLKGTLTRQVVAETAGLDENGDPIDVGPQTFPFQGMIENFSAFFRATVGIPDTDVGVLIFAESISTVPNKDDKVTLRNRQFQVRKVLEVDPAEATYRLQCFEVKNAN